MTVTGNDSQRNEKRPGTRGHRVSPLRRLDKIHAEREDIEERTREYWERRRGVPRDTRDTVRRGANTHLLDVEDEIELAHILEALVERLDEDLDQVEDAELTLGRVDGEHEVESRVVPVDQLGILPAHQADERDVG